MRIYILKAKNSNKIFATSTRSIDCINMLDSDYQNAEQICLDDLPVYVIEALLKLPWTFEKP
jgi:hypothetical protein